jgi:MerR family redox-sensitive transcriptional activator SoxR
MNDEMMTIGEIAGRAGVNPSALRYYERVGLFLPTRRVSGQRRYSEDALHRLRLIQFAQGIGFSLEEIRRLLGGFPEATAPAQRWRALVPPKLAQIDLLIAQAQQMREQLQQTLRCGCATLDECAALCEAALLTP